MLESDFLQRLFFTPFYISNADFIFCIINKYKDKIIMKCKQ
jgi:hypothetical protein